MTQLVECIVKEKHILLRICRVSFAAVCLIGAANAAMASEGCPDVPGAAMLFERASTRVVWVVETHGTSEMPVLFGDLVCVASTTRRPVVVALKRGVDEQPLWDRFLNSDGRAGARAALLRGSDWIDATQDGRSSIAMLALAERLREYKTHGQIVAVTMIWPANAHVGAEHEADLANSVIDIVRHYPEALVLTYSGNVHAMKTVAPYDESVALAASLIAASERVTVNLAAGSDHPQGIVPIKAATEDTSKSFAAGFDAVGYTGLASTASPPAVAARGRH